jgi:hypothetical protein
MTDTSPDQTGNPNAQAKETADVLGGMIDPEKMDLYANLMERIGYTRTRALEVLHLHVVRHIDRVRTVIDELGNGVRDRGSAAELFRLLHVAYASKEIANEKRQSALLRAIDVLTREDSEGKDGEPEKTLRSALRYADLWSNKDIPLELEQRLVEALIRNASDASGNVVGKYLGQLEKLFEKKPVFLNALKAHVIRTGNVLHVNKIMGAMKTFSLPDIAIGNAIRHGSFNHKVGNCSSAERGHQRALLGEKPCALICVQGKIVAALKSEGDASIVALRDAWSGQEPGAGEKVLMKGHIYAIPGRVANEALESVDTLPPNAWRTYQCKELQVDELLTREHLGSAFLEVVSSASQRFVFKDADSQTTEDHASSSLGDFDRRAEQLQFLRNASDPTLMAYHKTTGQIIHTLERSIQKPFDLSRELQDVHRGISNNQSYLQSLRQKHDTLMQKRNSRRGIVGLLARIVGSSREDEAEITTLEEQITMVQKTLDGQRIRTEAIEAALKGNSAETAAAFSNFAANEVTFDSLECEATDDSIIRTGAILEYRSSGNHPTLWVTFPSYVGGQPDKVLRLVWSTDSSKIFRKMLAEANPLLPVEDMPQAFDQPFSVELPFVQHDGSLTLAPDIAKALRPFLFQENT